MRYAVVIEKAKRNYSAYIPDVPGCIATGKTVQQTLSSLREALEFHFEGMREDGEKIPDPETLVDYIDVGLQTVPIDSHIATKFRGDPNRRKRASEKQSA
ncbi:MAG TPA: type II toxin-antitoxin system HicB family antitoxin [Tepidisphaeraceae bacterium]|jgi:predicted RNase H-like HicB family nuclease|nr:type II toxin-antitoxin system HicB family antitoxin [Tepidisphaeraceae bacterium]